MAKFYSIFFLLLLTIPSIAAPAGTIEGVITDKATGETLPGAGITLGPGNVVVSDFDGNYYAKLPAGSYNLIVSYISYTTLKVDNVEVKAGETLRLNLELEFASFTLDAITITATKRSSSEMAMISSIKNAGMVVSGISAQQISRSQDRDASEVVKRVTGVSTVADRFVVVRGLAQRYNNVFLNGASTPSSEADTRAFSFDVIPSSLIESLEVFKSQSPELPADFSGGFIKIRTKNNPESSSLDISLGAGWRTGTTLNDYTSYKGSSADVLGFGASARQLPNNFPNPLNSKYTADQRAQYTRELNSDWSTSTDKALPDGRLSVALNTSKKFSDRVTLSSIAGINYSISKKALEISNARYDGWDTQNDAPSPHSQYTDEQYTTEVKAGALANFLLLVGQNTRYEFNNFFNQISKDCATLRSGVDYGNNYKIKGSESLYSARSTYSGQLSGRHLFSGKEHMLSWVAGYSYANLREPDRRMITSRMNDDPESEYYGRYRIMGNDANRTFQQLDEQAISGQVDYLRTLHLGGYTPTLKTGGLLEVKMRNFDAREFVYDFSRSLPIGYYYMGAAQMFSEEYLNANGTYLIEKSNKSNSYDAGRNIYAGYVSLKLPLGEHAYVDGGVRYEYTQTTLDSYTSDGTKSVNLNEPQGDIFPSVNATWNINERNVLRAAYGKSVNRSEFREIAPFVYYDYDLFSNFEGNSNLRNAYIQNVDVRYELYPADDDMISVGAFYKNFKDPIEVTFFETGGQLQYTFTNADGAYAYGLEADLRKSLDFIGLKNFMLIFNGTLIKSRVTFAPGGVERDRPLQGQSPYLINAGVAYRNNTNKLSANLQYNIIGKRMVTAGQPKQNPQDDIPDAYEIPHHSLDFSMGKRWGNFEVKAGVKDILNSKIVVRQFVDFEYNGVHYKRHEDMRSYRSGTVFNFSIGYSF